MDNTAPDAYTNLDDFLDSSLEKGEVVGSWGFSSHIDFTKMSSEENNVWFFEQVFNFLRSFFGAVMPDALEIITYNAGQQINRENLDQMTFLDELMLIMKNLKEPIWVLKLSCSLVGFVRADWDPDNPIRIRIQEPANFIIWGGPDESGFQSFSISFNLFSSQQVQGQGVELWSVNQPLLEKALGKWEAQTGQKIDTVQGNSPDLALDRSGFSKPAPASPASLPSFPDDDDDLFAPKTIEEEPEDDWFPDLDDL